MCDQRLQALELLLDTLELESATVLGDEVVCDAILVSKVWHTYGQGIAVLARIAQANDK